MYDPDWRVGFDVSGFACAKLKKNDYLHKPKLENVTGRIWNVYSEADSVQRKRARNISPWEVSRVPNYPVTANYSNIEITQKLKELFPNEDLYGPLDGKDTHSKLHSPEIASFIAELLIGKQSNKKECK